MTTPMVTGIQPQVILPTMFRFKAMNLMTRIERDYRDHWESLKKELVLFISTWKEQGLDDPVS
jgi:hypothetical protein